MTRVFIVEDEAIVAMELKDQLRMLGYEVCGHAARADAALREIPASRPDLVLMDINLGGGMTGLDVAERLRGTSDAPVVFVTAYSDAELVERAAGTDSFAYILKPFNPQALRANVEMALARHAAEGRLREANRKLDETAASLRERTVELSRASSLLEAAFEATEDGLLVLDREGGVVRASARFAEMWRVPAEILAARSHASLRKGKASLLADPDAWRRRLDQIVAAPEREAFDLMTLRDGRVMERYVRPHVLDGAVVGQVISLRDVTARVRAKEALAKSEARFRALFEQAGVGVAEVDAATGRFLRVNRRCSEIMGYSEEELVALDFTAIIHPDDRTVGLAEIAALGHGELREVSVEKRYIRKDGTLVWANLTVSRLAAQGATAPRNMAVVNDITARKHAEEALLRERRLLSESQRIASIGSWSVELATGAVTWTDETYRLYGQSRGSFVPTAESLIQLLHAEDRAPMAWIEPSASGEPPPPLEYRVILPDGTVRFLRGQGEVARSENGAPIELIGTVQDITERRRAEAAVHDSEARYRRLFEEALEGIFRIQLDGAIVDVNPAFARMVGHASPEALIGTNAAALYADPEDRRRIREQQRGGDVIEGVEARWRRKNGDPLTVEISGRVIRDERGEPAHYQGFVRDVSEQRQHQAALNVLSTGLAFLTGEALFNEVAAHLAAIAGAEIGFVGMLQAGERPRIRTLGLVVDGKAAPAIEYELAGTPCEHVIAGRPAVFPEGVQQLFPDDGDLVAMGAVAYVASALLDAGGRPIGHVGVFARRPIENPGRVESLTRLFAVRTAAELERHRAEARFVGVFEFSPDAVLMVDERGRIVLANGVAERFFGYTRAELLLLSVEDLVPTADRPGHAKLRQGFVQQATSRTMSAQRGHLTAIRKDGTTLPVEISLSPMPSDEGRLTVAAVRDVTARVLAEKERARLAEQLRQAQKMEAIGTLAGGIAHDFNNLLAAIVANVELARGDVVAAAPIAESLDAIAAASSRATQLVRQILAFSQAQPVNRSSTSVRMVIEEVARLLRASLPSGVQLVTELQELAPRVLADPTQLHQVLMNLTTNSLHALERETGRITLRLEAATIDEASQGAVGLSPGRYARIQVCDDGKGMDAATIERIFEPFFTTKEVGKGTGLGLAVVHGIVTDHGGAITVSSVPGSGTTFSVYLPEGADDGRESPAERPVAARATAGHVLYIDDEQPLLRGVSRLLERLGYQATAHNLAAEALEVLRADPGRFDVVVVDQNMPTMSGTEVARELHRLRPDLPIVLVSGNLVHTDDELAAVGIRHHLDKPFTGEQLGNVLALALGRR